MKSLFVTSTNPNAGKTTLIIGLAKNLSNKKVGYMKPFGERIVYKKKRLWDYDAASIVKIFKLDEVPENLSIGFDHSKIMYMYNEEQLREKILEALDRVGEGKDIVFVEDGRELSYGASVGLDGFNIASTLRSDVVLVASGEDYEILDTLAFLKKTVNIDKKINLRGVVINKIDSMENWEEIYKPIVEKMGIKVIGLIPRRKELEVITPRILADQLFAKIVVGEEWLDREIENTFIGAMSASAAAKSPLFSRENKLIITSGDRTDLILVSIENNTSCIILTNNILPPSHIIEKARKKKVPLLLVPWDTFQTAKYVEGIKILVTERDEKKIKIIEELIRNHTELLEMEIL